jgi:hypothetical protein
MKIKTINLTKFGIDQEVWIYDLYDLEAEDVDTGEKFELRALYFQKVIIVGVWYGIKDGEEKNIFDVRYLSDHGQNAIFQVDDILYSEYAMKKKLENPESNW